MAATADRSKPFIPLAGGADDGFSNADEASATCFCGAVQLKFPTHGPGLGEAFICNCYDCHKLTASMFASNFVVLDTHLVHLRGEDNLTQFGQSKTVATGNKMTNFFCKTCGTLMYRVGAGFPGMKIMRIGTVDDFNLHATILKPKVEQFVKDRAEWVGGGQGIKQVAGNHYADPKASA
ncbi:hypothetical protein PENSPDRAFT_732085 [Peniophora sp. CONT]|nr:hypothetical protein PENSPDRAFT_732085 [Peniophora sp. CONT]